MLHLLALILRLAGLERFEVGYPWLGPQLKSARPLYLVFVVERQPMDPSSIPELLHFDHPFEMPCLRSRIWSCQGPVPLGAALRTFSGFDWLFLPVSWMILLEVYLRELLSR